MKRHSGFTLIEMMIIVAIIGILAAIAIPKFSNILRKTQEGSTKGALGAMRSAITLYYTSMEALYISAGNGLSPAENLSNPDGPFRTRYLDQIPTAKLGLPVHNNVTTVIDYTTASVNADGTGNPAGWFYGSSNGLFVVGCTHTDTKSVAISAW